MKEVARDLKDRLPGAEITLDPPDKAGGTWWMDVHLGDRAVVVEWRPSMGFGISWTPSDGYGEGPDEFYDSSEEALARIVELLESGLRTQPLSQLVLRRLREAEASRR